ncbi:hypothetical protein ABID59_004356 [Bradyrhizobium sp. S3.3.6]
MQKFVGLGRTFLFIERKEQNGKSFPIGDSFFTDPPTR